MVPGLLICQLSDKGSKVTYAVRARLADGLGTRLPTLYTVQGFLVFGFLSPTHSLYCASVSWVSCVSQPHPPLYCLCFWGLLCFSALCVSGLLCFLHFSALYTVCVSGVSCVSCVSQPFIQSVYRGFLCFLCFSAPPTVYMICVSGVSCVSCVSQPHPPFTRLGFWGFLCFLCFPPFIRSVFLGFLVFLAFLSPTHHVMLLMRITSLILTNQMNS